MFLPARGKGLGTGAGNRSIRTALLWWLLPLAAVFMTFAWLIHGTLLDRMSRDFVREHLHQEADLLERQVRDSYPDIEAALLAGHHFDEVFHHIFALRIGDWDPLESTCRHASLSIL